METTLRAFLDVTAHARAIGLTSVHTSTSVESEEAAVALDVAQASAEHIVSDSKAAVCNYAVRRVGPLATGILRQDRVPCCPIQVIWVTAQAAILATRRQRPLPAIRLTEQARPSRE
ncbi:hypothetical protein HPB50_016972 [Hyalomma asiaticum]|uniref:Uncharacterized protein n=1 Tax=Hyalomma asiaticum TaxID=266040 RepID=A0ACB7RRS7_HYAAI|nr:hypothetical protein HPB50_016972 [Hyalomma asiaticum]